MLKNNLSLSDVADFFKKSKSTATEEVDEFYQYLISASGIAALLLAPNPLTAITAFCGVSGMGSIKISSLMSWLPDKLKYGKQGRNLYAVERLEHLSITHFILLNLSIRVSFEEVFVPLLKNLIGKVELSEEEAKTLEQVSKVTDKRVENMRLDTLSKISNTEAEGYADELITPLLNLLSKIKGRLDLPIRSQLVGDLSVLQDIFNKAVDKNYNAFVINFSKEFPEFWLWFDNEKKKQIITQLKLQNDSAISLRDNLMKQVNESVFVAFEKFKSIQDEGFIAQSGFPNFSKIIELLSNNQNEFSIDIISQRVRENILAHHNHIISELDTVLVDNEVTNNIVYPVVRNSFIGQSYSFLIYEKKKHRREFLTTKFWTSKTERGENLDKELLLTLADPEYAYLPIVILGNPGAGKTMLCKMFAGALIETNNYIPFLIKLRDVGTGTSNISEHISKGLSKSIASLSEINWIDWAKEVREKTPVIILDGFDELMQFNQAELNNYLNAIKEFQQDAIHHGILVRVILTSRITVMQEVNIPERTKIIRLNGFDDQRKKLWCDIWNSHQKEKTHHFALPKNDKVQMLAQEPLLLFMLAIFDFKDQGLQKMTNLDKSFNQSKLYDSLLNDFAVRQLRKDEHFIHSSNSRQTFDLEEFRLRLGSIALMMFLNNTTNRDIGSIEKDIEAFELNSSENLMVNVLGSFFFIHENKSTTQGDSERLDYEFLHKTFGEFLAADFLLRIARSQVVKGKRNKLSDISTFKFCFGYNWLYRHANILFFLMEHASNIIEPGEQEAMQIIEDVIIKDLKVIFDKGFADFPVSDYGTLKKPFERLDHLAIYSQNLIYLWLALAKNNRFEFELFDYNINYKFLDASNKSNFDSGDLLEKEELNRNKRHWKRLCALWVLVGSRQAVARLRTWMLVKNLSQFISIQQSNGNIASTYLESAQISHNELDCLLAVFYHGGWQIERHFNLLEFLELVISRNPNLTFLAIDAAIYSFREAPEEARRSIFEWLLCRDLSAYQSSRFLECVVYYKGLFNEFEKYKCFSQFLSKSNAGIILREFAEDLNHQPVLSPLNLGVEIIRELISQHDVLPFLAETDPASLIVLLEIIVKIKEKEFKVSQLQRTGFFKAFKIILNKVLLNEKGLIFAHDMHLRVLNNFFEYQDFDQTFFEPFEKDFLVLFDKKQFSKIKQPQVLYEFLKLFLNVSNVSKFYIKSSEKVRLSMSGWIDNPDQFFAPNYLILLEIFRVLNELKLIHSLTFTMDLRSLMFYLHQLFRRKNSYLNGGFNIEFLELFYQILLMYPSLNKNITNLFRRGGFGYEVQLVYLIENEPKYVKTFLETFSKINKFSSEGIAEFKQLHRKIIQYIDQRLRSNVFVDEAIAFDLIKFVILAKDLNISGTDALGSILPLIQHSGSAYKERLLLKICLLLLEYDAPPSALDLFLRNIPELFKLYEASPENLKSMIKIYKRIR